MTAASGDIHDGVVSIESAVSAMPHAWSPADLAEANGNVLRLAKLEGGFHWHHHAADELFLCWRGTFRIELLPQRSGTLRQGDSSWSEEERNIAPLQMSQRTR